MNNNHKMLVTESRYCQILFQVLESKNSASDSEAVDSDIIISGEIPNEDENGSCHSNFVTKAVADIISLGCLVVLVLVIALAGWVHCRARAAAGCFPNVVEVSLSSEESDS